MFEILDNCLNGFLKENKEFSGLSEGLQKKLESWDSCKTVIKRPQWKYYFMSLAWMVRMRSIDGRTKCGTIITNENNHLIGSGYNSPIKGIDDRILPNFNEAKYPFFIHSEINAIINAANLGNSTNNSIFYITGEPCFNCLQAIYQCGAKTIYYGNNQAKMTDNQEYKEHIELFKYLTGGKLPLIHLDFDLNNLKELLEL